jgi:hypothetical protein
MGIEMPASLQWVSYLAGSHWPQGDETVMFGLADDWHASAEELDELIPDLNRVRAETMENLSGDTADAAEQQFAMLFDGDYAVDKLADAMSALGDLAHNAANEIEYTKLQIISTLAIVAAEIMYALAMAWETFGGSLSWIPAMESITWTACWTAAKRAPNYPGDRHWTRPKKAPSKPHSHADKRVHEIATAIRHNRFTSPTRISARMTTTERTC